MASNGGSEEKLISLINSCWKSIHACKLFLLQTTAPRSASTLRQFANLSRECVRRRCSLDNIISGDFCKSISLFPALIVGRSTEHSRIENRCNEGCHQSSANNRAALSTEAQLSWLNFHWCVSWFIVFHLWLNLLRGNATRRLNFLS